MMIASSSAGDPYATAAALDRALRSGSAPGFGGAAPSDDAPPDAGPDVVVSLSGGASAPPSTYDASGRMAGAPTPGDMGADAPDSMARATESDGGDDATGAPSDAGAAQDAAVPA